MSLKEAFKAIGWPESEAILLEFLVEHNGSTAEEIIDGTHLSRSTVYKSVKHLMENSYVVKSGKRPFTYSIPPEALSDVKTQFKRFYRKIVSQIKPKKLVDRRLLLKKISSIFEINGYPLRDPPRDKRPLEPHEIRINILDKIADGEYSLGIALFDVGKKIGIPQDSLSRFLPRFTWLHSRELNCVASFVFIDPNVRGYKTLIKTLRQDRIQDYSLVSSGQEKFGIEGNTIYYFSTEEDLEDKITRVLQELHQKRIVINSISRNLKTAIAQTHEHILLSQEHARRIENLFLENKSPFRLASVMKNFEEISDPVYRIKNREIRNLNIFRRKFSENELEINQTLEAFERRIFVPKVSRLEKYLHDLETIREKFRCIEYELDDLGSALFNYGVALVEGKQTKTEALINPFIFTEPYEKEPFFVDQTSLKTAALSLSNSILEDLPSFFQIVQAQAGMGKTHAAQYIYSPFAEMNGIKSLYIDCPLNYDFIAGIFQELTQESLYPSKIAGAVREIRRSTPSTSRDLLKIIGEITELWKTQGYKGLLIILDELENVVPYTYYEEYKAKKYQIPLSLRQIKELLGHHAISNLGLLFCCRSKIYSMLKDALKMDNLNDFTFEPEKLEINDFMELIRHRYNMWSIKDAPIFEEATIKEILEITKGNTRDSIKYLRELYAYSTRNGIHSINVELIKQIGPIPLFRY